MRHYFVVKRLFSKIVTAFLLDQIRHTHQKQNKTKQNKKTETNKQSKTSQTNGEINTQKSVNVGKHSNFVEWMCFKLGVKMHKTKLYILILVYVILTFFQYYRGARKQKTPH